MKKVLAVVMILTLLIACTFSVPVSTVSAAAGDKITTTLKQSDMSAAQWTLLNDLAEQYTTFVLTKHKQLGASHYAYTEAVSDTYNAGSPAGEENTDGSAPMFVPGAQLVLLELEKNGNQYKLTETVLVDDPTGVIRDPDVSTDGTRVLFSWKKSTDQDDYHLYEYDLITKTYRQLTFGLGVADTEPKYLPDGNIIFSSTRAIQTVDCWKVPVSNLYTCNADGENIVRVGYDQVHTTYPTVTSDGRVLYTRWDYNDRSQMYVQAIFQMFPDGTNQTEVFGNNACFPTTLLHTREVPGSPDKYISIVSGHHTYQHGKLVMIDTSKGRNEQASVTYLFPDAGCEYYTGNDHMGTKQGAQYKYPYALNESQLLVSYAANGLEGGGKGTIEGKKTAFDIFVMDTQTGAKLKIVDGTNDLPASQIVPVATRTLHERPTMVNYASNTGTYYIGDVYQGDGLKGIERGEAKYLRIVALDFRAYAIGQSGSSGHGTGDPFSVVSTGNGTWDVKRVLGVIPIEEDGSALFKIPSETPVYFQVLDKDGSVIQSMRSWSTLMPGESFSCVGCHEDKNTVPPAAANTTLAMKKGVQEIQPDLWQTGEGYEDYDPYTDSKGFSYLEEIQPIWDDSCVECHNDTEASFNITNAYSMRDSDTTLESTEAGEIVDIFPIKSQWKYVKGANLNTVVSNWNSVSFNDSTWTTGNAPFGDRTDNGINWATNWGGNDKYIWIRKTFTIDDVDEFRNAIVRLNTYYDDNPEFYINGYKFYEPDNWVDAYTNVKLSSTQSLAFTSHLVEGTNVFAIRCENGTGGRMIDTSLSLEKSTKKSVDIFESHSTGWQYKIDSQPTGDWTGVDYNANSWSIGQGGFGHNTAIAATKWGNNGQQTKIWLRKEFNLTADDIAKMEGMNLVLDIMYDQDPVIYLNGEEVLALDGFYDTSYVYKNLNVKYTDLLREGKNVLAIYCQNVTGGCYIDTGLLATEYDGTAFSLEGRMMDSSGATKAFPLSYLVLTGSRPSNNEWIGKASNDYTNWISCMSQCEMLDPYQFGATKSKIIKVLEGNHYDVELSDVEMRKIRAWIDLAVPAFGDYSEGNTWNSNEQRWADEYQNKRDYYEKMNELARKARAAGANAAESKVEITYKSGSTVYDDWYNFSGASKLEVPQKYNAGNTITVKLPEGEKYLGLTLDFLMGESIIYVPTGTFTYTVPSDMTPYNRTFKNNTSHTITARVVGEDELNERHNLAENPYDLTDVTANKNLTGGYPHAITDSNCRNESSYIVRNALDGVTANEGHGGYPNQSWGPELGNNHYMQVDFGRKVFVDEVEMVLRAQFADNHDSYYKSGTLEFSDGTKINIDIEKTSDPQSFKLDKVIETTYVKLTNLVAYDKSGDDWAAISEFKVYGTEGDPTETTGIVVTSAPVKTQYEAGEELDLTGLEVSAQLLGGEIVKLDADEYKVTGYDKNKSGTQTITVTYGDFTATFTVTVKSKADDKPIKPSIRKGDMNEDGKVTVSDILEMKRIIMSGVTPTEKQLLIGDLKPAKLDNKLTVSDILGIKEIIMG